MGIPIIDWHLWGEKREVNTGVPTSLRSWEVPRQGRAEKPPTPTSAEGKMTLENPRSESP